MRNATNGSFTGVTAQDAREETLRTVIDYLIAKNGDYRDLFTTPNTFLTRSLAALYAVPLVETTDNGQPMRWIHSPAAAVHLLMIPEIINSDIVVTNAASVHGPVVAEHAIAQVLALAKRLPSAVRYQQHHQRADAR